MITSAFSLSLSLPISPLSLFHCPQVKAFAGIIPTTGAALHFSVSLPYNDDEEEEPDATCGVNSKQFCAGKIVTLGSRWCHNKR